MKQAKKTVSNLDGVSKSSRRVDIYTHGEMRAEIDAGGKNKHKWVSLEMDGRSSNRMYIPLEDAVLLNELLTTITGDHT